MAGSEKGSEVTLLRFIVGLAFLAFAPSPGALAQSQEEVETLKRQIEALKQNQSTLQKEIEGIKDFLREKFAPSPVERKEIFLSVEDNSVIGDRNAKVTLVEFSDYQCPFCGRHLRQTMPQIEKNYIRSGRIKYVFRDYPIESIHPQAFKAAEAARCAGEHGQYWKMHDRLFGNQKDLGVKDLPRHAQAIGLDLPKFQECLNSGKFKAKIHKDMADGQTAGVRGTPTFFLGFTDANNSTVKTVFIIRGAQPYDAFKEAIEAHFSEQK